VLDRVVMAGKWRILLAAQGLVHSLGELVRTYFVATFYGTFLPTGVGGDVIRIMQVGRGNERALAVTASVVMERVLGLIASAVLVVLTASGFVVRTRPDLGLSSPSRSPPSPSGSVVWRSRSTGPGTNDCRRRSRASPARFASTRAGAGPSRASSRGPFSSS
jgi:uncharacterized membrane protein YbhN (UPF0104 family)